MDKILANIMAFSDTKSISIPKEPVRSTNPVKKQGKNDSNLSLAVICFSKERPYQLHQFLLSLETYIQGGIGYTAVLYLPCGFEEEYSKVFQFHSNVEGIRETSFSADLQAILLSLESKKISHVMFCVDDLIFTSAINAKEILKSFHLNESAFCVQMKLHPGIRYSHAGTKVCFPPSLFIANNSMKYQANLLSFDLSASQSDWRYPFDLCGSIYRLRDLQELIQEEYNAFTNPNNFEVFGNQKYWNHPKLSANSKVILCSTKPCISVVTINQVQSTYEVPIYCTDAISLLELNRSYLQFSIMENNKLLDQSRNYDFKKYSNQLYVSVHIGDLFILPPAAHIPPTPSPSFPRVTILLPIFNGEAFIEDCLDSLFQSEQGCPFILMVMNDGSTDSSLAILENYRAKLFARQPNPFPEQYFQIISFPENRGLSIALDEGIKNASTEYIARIDCDDQFLNHRLLRQIEYLDQNPQIHVLGCQACRFSTNLKTEVPRDPIITMYNHPVLVEFAFHFHCPVLHPSVMFRREIILSCGGYTGSTNETLKKPTESDVMFIEDYSLWSRVREKYPCSIANLSDVLLKLRSHETSKSKIQFTQALQQSRLLQCHSWNNLLSSLLERKSIEITPGLLDLILKPQTIESFTNSQADDAIQAIDDLYQAFLISYLKNGTNNIFSYTEENKRILEECLYEMKQRYINQLISVTMTKNPDFLIPIQYKEQYQYLKNQQLKMSVLQVFM